MRFPAVSLHHATQVGAAESVSNRGVGRSISGGRNSSNDVGNSSKDVGNRATQPGAQFFCTEALHAQSLARNMRYRWALRKGSAAEEKPAAAAVV